VQEHLRGRQPTPHTDNSHHRYDVLLLINGVPVAQIELKTLGINPRRAIEQIVEYKNDLGDILQILTTHSQRPTP